MEHFDSQAAVWPFSEAPFAGLRSLATADIFFT